MPRWLDNARAGAARLNDRAQMAHTKNLARRDALFQEYGYASHEEYRAEKKMRRAGYRWCLNCKMNVRPQPPWGFARIVTLGLLTPGKFECPRCKGTIFDAPVV